MRRPLAVAVPARAPMSKPEGPEGSVRAAFGHVRPIFIPVHLDGLVLDSVVDFHLHLQTSPGHFVLFRGPDLEFTTAHHRRLLANKVETLWLKGDERRRYEQYVERHLETLLGNPQIATPRKVELLQSAAQTTLEAVMVDPRHTEAVPRTRRVAQQTVQLIVRDRDALGHMAALMARDYDTVRHSMNVSVFATGLAAAAGVTNPSDLRDIALGGLLHDIGRIAAIADVYDAMTSDRSYQRAMKPVDALHLMTTHLAPHFDRTLLQHFVKTLRAPRTQ